MPVYRLSPWHVWLCWGLAAGLPPVSVTCWAWLAVVDCWDSMEIKANQLKSIRIIEIRKKWKEN